MMSFPREKKMPSFFPRVVDLSGIHGMKAQNFMTVMAAGYSHGFKSREITM